MTELETACKEVCPSSSEEVGSTTVESSVTRIPLPLMSGPVEAQYKAERTEEATTLVWNCDRQKCDEPLQLRLPVPGKHGTPVHCNDFAGKSELSCMIGRNNAFSALIAAYDDDAEDQ